MKLCTLRSSRLSRGFTLIELLVVISIIAILASLLLPVISTVKTKAKVASAKLAMRNLGAAFTQYEGDYNRLPSPGGSGTRNDITGAGDYTYGYFNGDPNASELTNAGPMIIITDQPVGANLGHARNPRQLALYAPSMVSDPSPTLTSPPGFSTVDYQFRDPWGTPYVITLNFKGDGKCRDALYSLPAVSAIGTTGAYNGLVDSVGGGAGPFVLNGSFMIWSMGPDKTATNNASAKAGPNKDNILSWVQ